MEADHIAEAQVAKAEVSAEPQTTLVPWETDDASPRPRSERARARPTPAQATPARARPVEEPEPLAERAPPPLERFTPVPADQVALVDGVYVVAQPVPDPKGCLRSLMLLTVGGVFGYLAGALFTAFTLSIAPVGRPPYSEAQVVVEPAPPAPPAGLQAQEEPEVIAEDEPEGSEVTAAVEDETGPEGSEAPAPEPTRPATRVAPRPKATAARPREATATAPREAPGSSPEAPPAAIRAAPAPPPRKDPAPPPSETEWTPSAVVITPISSVLVSEGGERPAPTATEGEADGEEVAEDDEKKRGLRLFKRKDRDR